jgi:holliday junction DNA helicase RuvB
MPTEVPMGFEDFVGNEQAIEQVKLLIEDSKESKKLPHIGFFGPAGHGKTTLSKIIADETKRRFVYVNSVAVKTPMILRGIITNPENMMHGAVICLDECHRLPKPIQDNLLSVLEEPAILVTSYKDQLIRDTLPEHLSFVLATTHQGMLSEPLITRLECVELHEYTTLQRQTIAVKYLNRVHGLKGAQLDTDAILEIGRRSRSGRHVVKICENVMRYMRVEKLNKITVDVVNKVFSIIGVDHNGLTRRDSLLLKYLAQTGSCGLDTLEAYLHLPRKDIKDKVEPWLLRRQLMIRSSSGRAITEKGMAALRGERVNV